ncbi:MAG: ABC transporter ATP-binding protein/permease [Lachnospiraceae bacterium]|nr:ABC transporter ATP-binding protein/permease [Lachnospiraceae bacterium]
MAGRSESGSTAYRLSAGRMLLKYLGKHSLLVVLSIVLALASSLTALFVPVLFGQAIDNIMVDINYVVRCLIQVGIVIGITAFMQWLMAMVNNKVTYEVTQNIRNDAFRKIQQLPLSYLDSHSTGETVSRMVADVDTLADGLLMGFTQAFTGIVTIIGTIYYMWTLSKMTTIVVVCVTPLSLFVAHFIAKHTHDMFVTQSVTRGEQTALIDEMIGNEKVVKSFGYEDEALQRFNEVNDRLAECSLKALFYSSTVNPATRFVNATVYALVALVGAFRVITGHITVGSLSALLAYATQYTKPFNEISGVVTELQNAFACASRVFALITEDAESDNDIYDSSLKGVEDVKGQVDIEAVSFAYDKNKPLIENFNLSVKPGQTVAIVGPTGCGKTTLINLLMRFYDVDGGKIYIDGEDISVLSRQEHRSRFGMVLQDTWIRKGTVLDNIRIGRPDATREECIEAAKEAHAHSFIRRLPRGYDTVLAEDGGDLSVGQKQLLCITRVMLALPPILILDEATSSIDTRTEIRIQKAFHKMMQGRTGFIVAHRLSTIMDADIIVVMRDGHIIEQGDHKTLLDKGGFYKELFEAQFAH